MARRLDPGQPFGDHERVGAEIERQHPGVLGVERLDPRPDRLALGGIEFALERVDRRVDLRLAHAGIVLALPVIGFAGDHLRMQRRARHRFGRGEPRIHRQLETALGRAVAEEHARRLVADAHLDARAPPLALQRLLHRFAQPIPGGGAELERQALARRVLADSVDHAIEARFGQQRLRAREIEAKHGQIGRGHRVARAHEGMRHLLLAFEQLAGQRLAVQRMHHRAAHARILQDRMVEIEVDMLVEQRGLIAEIETRGLALFQSQGLIEREAKLARDVIDRP